MQVVVLGPLVTLTLNRPHKLNALNCALVSEPAKALQDLSRDRAIRAIVLTGVGRTFSAGLDPDELTAAEDGLGGFVWTSPQQHFSVAANCPIPIITAVNSPAVACGMELALRGDFLIASDTATFADTHTCVGVAPSCGLMQVLPRLIGPYRAKCMSLSGDFIDAASAREWGLVTEACAPEELLPRDIALTQQIAETERKTAGNVRGLMEHSVGLPLAQSLAREAEVFNDHIAGVQRDQIAVAR